MKIKKLLSMILAAAVAATVLSGFAVTANAAAATWTYIGPNGAWIGTYGASVQPFLKTDTMTASQTGTLGEDCIAEYSNGVLKLAGTGTIQGDATRFGAAIAAVDSGLGAGDMVIELQDGANIVLDGVEPTKQAWGYGIAANAGSITIKGNGKLTINAGKGTKVGAAIITWGGTMDVVIDGAEVVANGGGLGKGIDAGKITLKNGAKLTAKGMQGALSKAPVLEGTPVMALGSEDANGADAVDYNAADLSTYKYVYIEAEKAGTPTGVYIGGDDNEFGRGNKLFYKNGELVANAVLGQDGCIAQYIPETKTLKLAGKGEIKRTEYSEKTYGVIYVNEGDLNIELADDADISITFDAQGQWMYGIYLNKSGSLNISGGGKLTVYPGESSEPSNGDASAICSYKGGKITIDGAEVIANGGVYGYGISPYPANGGTVEIKNNAKLLARGGKGAIWVTSTPPAIYDGAAAEAGTSFYKSALAAYDSANAASYKVIKVGNPSFDVPKCSVKITAGAAAAAAPGGSVNIAATSDAGDKLYVAQYDAAGMLKNVEIVNATGYTVNHTAEVSDIAGGKITALLWNGAYVPRCAAASIPVAAE